MSGNAPEKVGNRDIIPPKYCKSPEYRAFKKTADIRTLSAAINELDARIQVLKANQDGAQLCSMIYQ